MDLKTYYSILEWRGENPTKIDPISTKEYGKKAYEQDIALGKVVWVNNKLIDFKLYCFYHDPFLSMISSSFNKSDININACDILIVLLLILSISSILALITASIGCYEMNHDYYNKMNYNYNIVNDNKINKMNEILLMILCSAINGFVICIAELKWKTIQLKNPNLNFFLIDNGVLLCTLITTISLIFLLFFMINTPHFYIWFIKIYLFQFIFSSIFQLISFWIYFVNGWKKDHLMLTQLQNENDGSFYLPKCIYYITFKDYEEYHAHKNKIKNINKNNINIDNNDDELIAQPLLTTTNTSEFP